MTLDDFVAAGWREHGADAAGVMRRLPEGLALVETAPQVDALARLIMHVAGEHLGEWRAGIALLERLAGLGAGDPDGAAARAITVLRVCAGDAVPAAASVSERVRVAAPAAAALVGQGRLADAASLYEEAVALAPGLADSDPGVRALAVTSNNLACALEDKTARTADERALMLRAAAVARTAWARAGSWLHVERAEYRLAMSHLAAGEGAAALEHARRCLAIVDDNGGDPEERRYAEEAVQAAEAALAKGV